MILDSIKNHKLYAGLGPDFKEALEFLSKTDFGNTAAGRYPLKGGVFYLVQEYDTKPESEGQFEAHRKFIDVQFIVSGRERHFYAHLPTLKQKEQYSDEKDVVMFEGSGAGYVLEKGYFAVYFPEDCHMPNLRAGAAAEKTKKVVVKIPFKAV